MKYGIDITEYRFSADGTLILRNVSFSVAPGEYISLIGPNGAGKTTLLKCLMRINRGGDGNIYIEGKPLESYNQRQLARTLSYIPQSDARFLPFTVEEYVLMGRYPHLSPFTTYGSDDRSMVNEALEITGTAHIRHREITTLSGGERQMVALAAALAQGADIMLLDEPTTFLDPRHEQEIFSVLARLNREHGITVLMVTHNINAAALHSHRVGIMKEGAFVFDGPPRDMMSNDVIGAVYDTHFTFVRHPETGFPVIVPEGGVAIT